MLCGFVQMSAGSESRAVTGMPVARPSDTDSPPADGLVTDGLVTAARGASRGPAPSLSQSAFSPSSCSSSSSYSQPSTSKSAGSLNGHSKLCRSAGGYVSCVGGRQQEKTRCSVISVEFPDIRDWPRPNLMYRRCNSSSPSKAIGNNQCWSPDFDDELDNMCSSPPPSNHDGVAPGSGAKYKMLANAPVGTSADGGLKTPAQQFLKKNLGKTQSCDPGLMTLNVQDFLLRRESNVDCLMDAPGEIIDEGAPVEPRCKRPLSFSRQNSTTVQVCFSYLQFLSKFLVIWFWFFKYYMYITDN